MASSSKIIYFIQSNQIKKIMQFSIATKEQISNKFKTYLDEKGMTDADFNRTTGFPADYISSIKLCKWDKAYPKQEHFERLCDLIGFQYKKVYWQHFKTSHFEDIEGAFLVAKIEKKFVGIDGVTGIGKTYALERLTMSGSNNFYTKADSTHSRIDFLENACNSMGLKVANRNSFKMQNQIVERLTNAKDACWTIDEAEYFKKAHFDVVKSIFDNVKGKAGIILCGYGIKELLEKKALSTQGKKGWAQLARRINQNWELLSEIGCGTDGWKETVKTILKELAKGRFNDSAVSWLTNRTENFDDLRTFVTEILITADEDQVKVIGKKYLDSIF